MTHDEHTNAVRLSLVATDDGRASHRGTYANRPNRDEAATRLKLHPVRERDRLDNVTYLYPRPTGPEAA